jgi:hypothetical protein
MQAPFVDTDEKPFADFEEAELDYVSESAPLSRYHCRSSKSDLSPSSVITNTIPR